jgi:hypothetical protein
VGHGVSVEPPALTYTPRDKLTDTSLISLSRNNKNLQFYHLINSISNKMNNFLILIQTLGIYFSCRFPSDLPTNRGITIMPSTLDLKHNVGSKPLPDWYYPSQVRKLGKLGLG